MRDGKKHHIIITGTGRSGTTFLMKLMTRLGFDTGFDLNYLSKSGKKAYFEECNAGLEYQGIGDDLPYIIKNPKLMWELPELLKNNSIVIDHVIIPIRDLYAASESRRVNVRNAPEIKDPRNVPGGLEEVTDPQQQEQFFLEKFYNFSLFLSTYNIPVTLLQYPRLVSDSDYLYHKLNGIFKGIHKDHFDNVFKEILNPNLIHKYNSNDIYFSDVYDDSFNILSECVNNEQLDQLKSELACIKNIVEKNENKLAEIYLKFTKMNGAKDAKIKELSQKNTELTKLLYERKLLTVKQDIENSVLSDQIKEKELFIQKHQKEIENLKNIIREKETVINKQRNIIQQKEKLITEKNEHINLIFSTISWRITQPLRLLRRLLRRHKQK